MPRIVDHDRRRRDIVEALLTIAARDGLNSASSRAIAAELDMATGALWHYFPTFDAVLSAAFETVLARTNERIARATKGLTGLAGLHAMMKEILPTGKVTQDEARLVVDFWGRVALNEALATHHIDHERAWRARLTDYLVEAQTAGELVEQADVGGAIDLLLVLASGQQVAYVLGAGRGHPEEQARLVTLIVSPWLSRPGTAGRSTPPNDGVSS